MNKPKSSMSKPMLWMLVAVVVIFGGIFGFNGLRAVMIQKFFKSYVPPPQAVTTEVVKTMAWQPYLASVGNMTAIHGVDISPETSGQVKAIYFQNGQTVTAGQPLIQLEASAEHAQLDDITAQLQLAQMTLDRTEKLYEQRATPLKLLDDARSKVKQLKANLENVSSAISKKLIRAPFAGKIGIKQINLGQYVNAGQVCVSLQSTNALYVKYNLPQQDVHSIHVKLWSMRTQAKSLKAM